MKADELSVFILVRAVVKANLHGHLSRDAVIELSTIWNCFSGRLSQTGWDPAAVLELRNPSHWNTLTCKATTYTTGMRCRWGPQANHDQTCPLEDSEPISDLVSRLRALAPGPAAQQEGLLLDLAHAMLCSKHHQNQATTIMHEWQRSIQAEARRLEATNAATEGQMNLDTDSYILVLLIRLAVFPMLKSDAMLYGITAFPILMCEGRWGFIKDIFQKQVEKQNFWEAYLIFQSLSNALTIGEREGIMSNFLIAAADALPLQESDHIAILSLIQVHLQLLNKRGSSYSWEWNHNIESFESLTGSTRAFKKNLPLLLEILRDIAIGTGAAASLPKISFYDVLATMVSKDKSELDFLWPSSYGEIPLPTYLAALREDPSWSLSVVPDNILNILSQTGVDFKHRSVRKRQENTRKSLQYADQIKIHLPYLTHKVEEALLKKSQGKSHGDTDTLRIASFNNECDLMRKLIRAGANIEGQDSLKRRPLHHAAVNRCDDAVRLLLNSGANWLVKDWFQQTAESLARLHPYSETELLILAQEGDHHVSTRPSAVRATGELWVSGKAMTERVATGYPKSDDSDSSCFDLSLIGEETSSDQISATVQANMPGNPKLDLARIGAWQRINALEENYVTTRLLLATLSETKMPNMTPSLLNPDGPASASSHPVHVARSLDSSLRSALSYAAEKGHAKIFQALLPYSQAVIDRADASGHTPLVCS